MGFLLKIVTINNVVNFIFLIFIYNKTEIEMTGSLANFLTSLVAGALVISDIGFALVVISKSDRITRS